MLAPNAEEAWNLIYKKVMLDDEDMAEYWDDDQEGDFIDEDQILDANGLPIVTSHTYEH